MRKDINIISIPLRFNYNFRQAGLNPYMMLFQFH